MPAQLTTDLPLDPTDQEFQAALLDWLKFHGAMLIGEVVPETLRSLRGNPACTAMNAYDHVIVDEYQDLNKAEQELLDLLSQNGNQAIVGDVDQSIYSFRHANPEGIANFGVTRPGTHDETLDECRRCPKLVVRLAAYLIKHNHPPRAAVRLNPRPANPEGEVHVVQWTSLVQEASGLASFIKSLIDGGHSPEDILVLSPRRAIGYGIRDAIAAEGLSVHSFYGEEPLEAEEAQQALVLLILAADPQDRVAMRWWLGYGSPTWRAGQYQHLREYCEQAGVSPYDTLEALVANTITLPHTNQFVERFTALKSRIAAIVVNGLGGVIDELFPVGEEWATGLRDAGLSCLDDAENITDLKAGVIIGVTQREVPEVADFVRVMSLHKSKGLTSKTVVIAGCTDGLIPFIPPDETPARQVELMKEQRRLFYVAVTRCTERLVLSSVNHIEPRIAHQIGAKIRGRGNTIASRFLHELGPDLPAAVMGVDWEADAYASH